MPNLNETPPFPLVLNLAKGFRRINLGKSIISILFSLNSFKMEDARNVVHIPSGESVSSIPI